MALRQRALGVGEAARLRVAALRAKVRVVEGVAERGVIMAGMMAVEAAEGGGAAVVGGMPFRGPCLRARHTTPRTPRPTAFMRA